MLHHMKSEKHQLLLLPNILDHQLNKIKWSVWYQKCWKVLGHHWANPVEWTTKSLVLFTQMVRVSDPRHTTAYIDYAPNLIPTLRGRVDFSYLWTAWIWKLMFIILLFQRTQPCINFAYYCVHFLTTTTLDKIWLSGKFLMHFVRF